MNKSSTRTRILNKIVIAILLTFLVVSSSTCIQHAQGDYRRKALVFVATTNGSSIVTVHIIDVGQGDSILIDTPSKDVLIDGGPETAAATVLDYLSNNVNITHIHLMIATHVHEDHIGGLVAVLNSTINVDEILINNQTCTTKIYTSFMDLAKVHTITVAQRGQTFPLAEDTNLTVFNPVQPLEFTEENDNSVVVKLQVSNTSFLLTGDAEADAEQSMLEADLNLQSYYLKVGHHGSRTATSQPFLDEVQPSYAIISAGIGNKYGHPHQETLDKLNAMNVTIYGTYELGTINIIIPEFQLNIFLLIFMTATLLAAIARRIRNEYIRIGKTEYVDARSVAFNIKDYESTY
jgi:beta-lactamase superfamily II metal-dependent hydrolase